MTDAAIIGMFFDEMDRRIRSMQARGIQPCDPSADVYTLAGPKAVAYARELLADRDRLAAELSAARADAERYRWLRGDTAGDHSQRWARWDVRCWLGQHWSDDLRREHLDAAIDAARVAPSAGGDQS